MKTEKVVYNPEVILPLRKNDKDNKVVVLKHSPKNAALLTASLLALAANAKASIQCDNIETPKTNIVIRSEQPKASMSETAKAKENDNNDNSGGLLLLILGGGMFAATKLFDDM